MPSVFADPLCFVLEWPEAGGWNHLILTPTHFWKVMLDVGSE